MYLAMQLKFTSLISLFCNISQAYETYGICGTRSHDGRSTKYCCDFYEETNNGCVACQDGFESFQGSPCRPCSSNTYGTWCGEQCYCMTNQRCDHISGCMDVITTVDLYQGYSRVLKSVTEKEAPNENPHKDKSNDENLYVYAFGGAVIFVMMLLGIYYKIRYYMSTNMIISQVPEINQMSEANRFESVYDEIDELALDDINQQPNLNNASVEDDTSNSSGTPNTSTLKNDEYLNPYQMILQNTENHKYSLTTAVVSSTQEKREDRICEELCNETYVNVKQDENTQTSSNYPDSQSLNYSDIPIDTKPVPVNLDGYENTRIFQMSK